MSRKMKEMKGKIISSISRYIDDLEKNMLSHLIGEEEMLAEEKALVLEKI